MDTIIALKPFKRIDRRFNKWYYPIVRIGTLPGKVRPLHRVFKTSSKAREYAERVIDRLEAGRHEK